MQQVETLSPLKQKLRLLTITNKLYTAAITCTVQQLDLTEAKSRVSLSIIAAWLTCNVN